MEPEPLFLKGTSIQVTVFGTEGGVVIKVEVETNAKLT
jgi:hypothetical protein